MCAGGSGCQCTGSHAEAITADESLMCAFRFAPVICKSEEIMRSFLNGTASVLPDLLRRSSLLTPAGLHCSMNYTAVLTSR